MDQFYYFFFIKVYSLSHRISHLQLLPFQARDGRAVGRIAYVGELPCCYYLTEGVALGDG